MLMKDFADPGNPNIDFICAYNGSVSKLVNAL